MAIIAKEALECKEGKDTSPRHSPTMPSLRELVQVGRWEVRGAFDLLTAKEEESSEVHLQGKRNKKSRPIYFTTPGATLH